MIRGFVWLLLLALPACGETLDEAVRELSVKVAARLGKGSGARVTVHNLSSLPGTEATRARGLLGRALRGAKAVEVTLTVSENLGGLVLVAEAAGSGVDMVTYAPDVAVHPARPSIEKRLLFEQQTRLLDVQTIDEWTLVLDTRAVTVYGTGAPSEQPVGVTPPLRDPRGRLEVHEDELTVSLSGRTCAGSWRPRLSLTCAEGKEPARFSAGRNTLEAAGWPEHYSLARAGAFYLLTLADGKVHIYDAQHKAVATFDGWGADVAQDYCSGSDRVVASGAAGPDAADTVALYAVADRRAHAVSDALELPGPVVALWPAAKGPGVVAIIRNLTSERYAAYSLTWDCGR